MNNELFFSLYNLAHQSVFLDWLIVFCANLFGYIMVLVAIIFLFFHTDEQFDYRHPFLQIKNKAKEIALVFFSALSAYIFSSILKHFIFSPRPFLVFENIKPLFLHGGVDSFPSGHATFFGALAFSLFLRHKRIGILYIFIAVIISLARVISGIHFPLDILAGWILGVIIALIFDKIFKTK